MEMGPDLSMDQNIKNSTPQLRNPPTGDFFYCVFFLAVLTCFFFFCLLFLKCHWGNSNARSLELGEWDGRGTNLLRFGEGNSDYSHWSN